MCATRFLALAGLVGLGLLRAAATSDVPGEGTQGGDRERAAPVTIDGLRGFTTTSTVVYEGLPDLPHRLETVYLFPRRARWWISLGSDRQATRQVQYRYGERVFAMAPGEATSVELEDDWRDEVLRTVEARRALFLWPHGFEWEQDGDARSRASIPGAPGEPPLGELVAELDDAGRVRVLRTRVSEGGEQERLIVKAWQTLAGRTWPREVELVAREQAVWTETVEAVDSRSRYVDSFFVPVDRRKVAATVTRGSAAIAVREIDLAPARSRLVGLPEETSWENAFERGAALRSAGADELAEAGVLLDEVLRFEIDAEGRPTYLQLRLADAERELAGWTRSEAKTGLSLVLEGPEELTPRRIDALLRAVPVGTEPRPAYVRRVGEPPSRRLQLVLPLVPSD